MPLNPTHDPSLTSRVEAANRPGADFPIQNLPFGVFRPPGGGAARVGVAIGDRIFDVARAYELELFAAPAASAAAACRRGSLNALMALGEGAWSALRAATSGLLAAGDARLDGHADVLVPMDQAELVLPVEIGDYTDFYSSIHHATRIGRLFRPDNPLMPNYKHLPVGYHGRASSVVASGTPVRRPRGQTRDDKAPGPSYGPSRRLDYELEVGFFVGPGNPLGKPLPIAEAGHRIFGFCLVNDWSARDLQKWEYQPLGPFLAKSFATSLSPWIVTAEALAPFRVPALAREPGDPAPLPHLDDEADRERGALDLHLEVGLSSRQMREQGFEPLRVSRGNFRTMYWTAAQMLAHHASNGCNLRPGDLLASGTVSGPEDDSGGCLLELTAGGREAIALPTGESRHFLEDGDEVVLRGWCERDGAVRIGFGECRGVVEPPAD